ncbi:hypothetical protein ACFYVL_40720 [Streptomyces sp. NPDC004111]
MRDRDEFNFSVGIQFGGAPLPEVRSALAVPTREQHRRNRESSAA